VSRLGKTERQRTRERVRVLWGNGWGAGAAPAAVDNHQLPPPSKARTSVNTPHRTVLLRLGDGGGTITECTLAPDRVSVGLTCAVHSVPLQNRS